MKKIWIALIVIAVLVASLFVYNYIWRYQRKWGPLTITGVKPCWWVYKTRGDYFDLHSVFLTKEGKLAEITYGARTLHKLGQSYVGYNYGCFFPRYFAFVNISTSEYKEAEEEIENKIGECWKFMEPFIENIIKEKCNKTNFDKFDSEEYPGLESEITGEGEIIESDALSISYINKEGSKDFCGATLSSEEKDEFKNVMENVSSCIDVIPRPDIFDNLINPDYLLDNIVDKDPFTEFYLCDVGSIDEVNTIIDNNELSTKCEKAV